MLLSREAKAPAGAVAQAGASRSSPYPTAEPRGHSSPGKAVRLYSVLPEGPWERYMPRGCILLSLLCPREPVFESCTPWGTPEAGGDAGAGVGGGCSEHRGGDVLTRPPPCADTACPCPGGSLLMLLPPGPVPAPSCPGPILSLRRLLSYLPGEAVCPGNRCRKGRGKGLRDPLKKPVRYRLRGRW